MNDFPNPEIKQHLLEIVGKFFNNAYVSSLLEAIISRTTNIRKDELIFYLSSIHPLAIELILEKHEELKIIPARTKKYKSPDAILKNLAATSFIKNIEQLTKHNNTHIIESVFSAHKNTESQLFLLSHYNSTEQNSSSNKQLIIQEFPETYARLLSDLIYPEWYTACFMSSCENSSVWGHYGDNHKGVCLIFKSEEEQEDNFLSMRYTSELGSSGPTHGNIRLKFERIDYEEGFGEIDFFRSLGRLSRTVLNSTWHTLNGEFSICAEDINKSEEDWRNLYWQQFYRDIKVKSPDWHYENEHRLILCDMLQSYSDPKDRALTYEFSSLKGIIFGINTSTEDKIKIMRIIEDKCTTSKREDFKFYQAYYSAQHKCIKHTELSLIKHSAPAI